MKKKVFACLASVLFLAGCNPMWTKMGGSLEMKEQNCRVEIPEGWVRYNRSNQNKDSGFLAITRLGFPLQAIYIDKHPIEADFPHTRKKLSGTMLPQEAAALALDSLRSSPEKMNFQLLENSPAVIGGLKGFKIVYSYETEKGLNKKEAIYGFIHKEWFYLLNYNAPARHYFEKDIGTFESICESFRLLTP